MCRCCNSQLFYGLSPLQRGQGSSLFTQHDREVTSLSRGTDMMSQSRWIHRSAPPEKAVLQAPRQGNPYQNGYGHLRQASAFTLSRGHILPDSSSLELTRLTQPGPFSQLLCFASPLDSFQLCLAHSYCNGLHSGGSMSSLFCCQGFRWMAWPEVHLEVRLKEAEWSACRLNAGPYSVFQESNCCCHTD